MVGDITPEDLGHRLDQVFAALPAEGPKDEVSEWTAAPPGGVEVLNRPIPQSVATFGELGLKRNDPDWYVATVMDNILGGGGFSSRLTAEVREKRGLAYSVYTALAPMDHGAVILGGVATRNERLGDSLRLIKDEWRRMRDEGPTDAELADAKTYLVGSFALRLDSSPSVAGLLVAIQLDHLGIDYLDRRADLIGGVTADDVRRVAKRLLDPDALIVTVVGQPEGLADDQSPRGGASQ